MSALSFRDAVPADIPTILQLAHAGDARGPETPPLDSATFSDPRYLAAFEALATDPNQRMLVAEKDGEVVGCLQITYLPGLVNFGMKRGQLENVHIRSDLRGGGYGSQMVNYAIGLCKQAGCGVVQLTSNKVRLDAHRFYKKLGFAQTHEGFKLRF